jgi:hypothetical protein
VPHRQPKQHLLGWHKSPHGKATNSAMVALLPSPPRGASGRAGVRIRQLADLWNGAM